MIKKGDCKKSPFFYYEKSAPYSTFFYPFSLAFISSCNLFSGSSGKLGGFRIDRCNSFELLINFFNSNTYFIFVLGRSFKKARCAHQNKNKLSTRPAGFTNISNAPGSNCHSPTLCPRFCVS